MRNVKNNYCNFKLYIYIYINIIKPLARYFNEFIVIFVKCKQLINSVLKPDILREFEHDFTYVQLEAGRYKSHKLNNKRFTTTKMKNKSFDRIKPNYRRRFTCSRLIFKSVKLNEHKIKLTTRLDESG